MTILFTSVLRKLTLRNPAAATRACARSIEVGITFDADYLARRPTKPATSMETSPMPDPRSRTR